MIRLIDDDNISISKIKLQLNNYKFNYCSLTYSKQERFVFIVYHNNINDIYLTKFNNAYQRLLWNDKINDFEYECELIIVYDVEIGFDDTKFQERFVNSKVLETIHYYNGAK